MMKQGVHTLLMNKLNLKTSMLRFSLCDSGDVYILVKENITVNNTAAVGAAANNTNKKSNI